jgi:hypothetical protein
MYSVSWVRLQEGAERLDAVHFGCGSTGCGLIGCDINMDAAATGYSVSWVPSATGCGMLRGAGCKWVRLVRLQLGGGGGAVTVSC